ncbi:uncharacterized protein LOC106867324 [Octopus bimaculoides]|uniref:Uncharacterized protein n=1 Tax=Octopus bimaculoides TaxID=37653 RepID=A0A0L8I1D5_OCTBM|nr:uncharacterized protein LOC106867324 [Octopus bimaculoides]|eukprot:XP_014767649.1 PREDICTED: uncharacterized protein LOC106867324 [Octopus bimaculoides]
MKIMETEISLETLEQQYILKIKLAIAFAILRNKPKEIPTRQYVEGLMSDYQKQISDLPDDSYNTNRNQLISCQQQLINQLESSNLIFQDAESSNILTPPPSGKRLTNQLDSLDRMLTNHTCFLQSSFNLRSVSHLLQDQHKITKVIEHTVIDSTKIIYSFLLTDIHKITLPCVGSTLKASMKICDLAPHNSNLRNSFKTFTADFQNAVIKKVILNDKITQLKKRDYIKLLSEFMHCHESKELLLTTLYNYASKFFNYIKKLSLNMRNLEDPVFFENNYFILCCLAECLAELISEHNLMPSQNFITDLTNSIENCFSLIEDTFPLIAHALWQIMVIIHNIPPPNKNGKNSNLILKHI